MNGYTSTTLISLLCLLSVNGQPTTISQSGCSYTFLVSKQEDNSCHVVSVASAPSNDKTDYQKSIIRNLQHQLSVLSQNYLQLEEEIKAIKNTSSPGASVPSNQEIDSLKARDLRLTRNVLELQEEIETIKNTSSPEASEPSNEESDSQKALVSLLTRNVLELKQEIEAMKNTSSPGAAVPSNEESESQKTLVSLLTRNVLELKEEIEAIKNNNGNTMITIGTNYVRWGRTSCPNTAELIYEGYSAKSYYNYPGGGANYICLDKNPKWPDGVTAGFQSYGNIHGVVYKTLTGLDSSLAQNDAPCAVCHVDGRGEHLMIPGNRTCPESWTKEYEGLLVSEHNQHQKATYVCLDGEPDVIPGGESDTNGGVFYTVEAECGALPCPPYVNGYEIACVVCTH